MAQDGRSRRKGELNLADCPDSPNCVSSLASSEKRRVKPMHFTTRPATAVSRMVQVVEEMGGRVAGAGEDWLRAVFTSPVFKFRDDVEMIFDGLTGAIHIRSASRTGWWDFGVNRRRVNRIRKQYYRYRYKDEE